MILLLLVSAVGGEYRTASRIVKRMMQASEIPVFIDTVINAGCGICGCGDDLYTIGDADLSCEEYETIALQLRAPHELFGDRDPVRQQIVAYLRAMGQYLDTADVGHRTLKF